MRILTHDELPDSFDAQVQLMQLSAGWGIFDFDHMKQARKMGYPFADYSAVYAIEENKVLSKVEVIHIQIETTKGLEIVSGISSVLTRRDKSRSGLARVLLQDVHQREKASGIRISLLWTGRNNKAHNLYESLAYTDVYGPGSAVLKTMKSTISNLDALKMRTATADDASVMDDLHSKVTMHHLGFTHRFKDFMKIGFSQIGFGAGFEKADSFRIFTNENKPVGYAQFQENNDWIRSSEVIIEPEYSEAAVSLLEKESDGRWLAFGNSFPYDSRKLLEKRGYSFSDYSYATLMALALDQNALEGENINSFLGTNAPRFVCHELDHF